MEWFYNVTLDLEPYDYFRKLAAMLIWEVTIFFARFRLFGSVRVLVKEERSAAKAVCAFRYIKLHAPYNTWGGWTLSAHEKMMYPSTIRWYCGLTFRFQRVMKILVLVYQNKQIVKTFLFNILIILLNDWQNSSITAEFSKANVNAGKISFVSSLWNGYQHIIYGTMASFQTIECVHSIESINECVSVWLKLFPN